MDLAGILLGSFILSFSISGSMGEIDVIFPVQSSVPEISSPEYIGVCHFAEGGISEVILRECIIVSHFF